MFDQAKLKNELEISLVNKNDEDEKKLELLSNQIFTAVKEVIKPYLEEKTGCWSCFFRSEEKNRYSANRIDSAINIITRNLVSEADKIRAFSHFLVREEKIRSLHYDVWQTILEIVCEKPGGELNFGESILVKMPSMSSSSYFQDCEKIALKRVAHILNLDINSYFQTGEDTYIKLGF